MSGSQSGSSETVTVVTGLDDWWFDPEESKHDEDHPKWFDDDEVVVGIKPRDAPMNLSTLCGVYRWVYDFPDPPESPAEILYSPTKTQHPGGLTISCPSGRKPTLKNIHGKVEHFGKVGVFNGIKRARTRDGTALAENVWEFNTFRWKKQPDDESMDDGHSMFALAVDDDSGEPFVMFRLQSVPPTGGGEMYLDIAAKKERRKGQSAGLTIGERQRLGMGLSYPEVRTAALAAELNAHDTSDDDTMSEMSSLEEDSDGPSRKRKTGRNERGARKKRRSAY